MKTEKENIQKHMEMQKKHLENICENGQKKHLEYIWKRKHTENIWNAEKNIQKNMKHRKKHSENIQKHKEHRQTSWKQIWNIKNIQNIHKTYEILLSKLITLEGRGSPDSISNKSFLGNYLTSKGSGEPLRVMYAETVSRNP